MTVTRAAGVRRIVAIYGSDPPHDSGAGARRLVAVAALVIALATSGMAPAGAAADDQAPGGPGKMTGWLPARKAGFGTSAGPASKVWFTLHRGALSEVFYPRLDVPSVRGLEFAVGDGRTFVERESRATRQRVLVPDERALEFTQVNTARSGRYRLVKTYFTDPARATLLVRVHLRSLDGGRYRLYALYDPALDNTVDSDSGATRGDALVARDGRIASALAAAPGFVRTSNGYHGRSDGWTDLRADKRMDWTYTRARDGNVVQTAQVDARGPATLALGFGPTTGAALRTARASLDAVASARTAYRTGWHRYLDSLAPPPASVADPALRRVWHTSAMVVRALEDKTFHGASVASPSMPWVWGQGLAANERGDTSVYHNVWARDLYHTATSMLAVGDRTGARRALRYLFDVQQLPDGSFPQNSWLDGEPEWENLQLDEVALPIVLAWQLGVDAATYRGSVKPAAEFVAATGPATPQERWENAGGYSPATLAAQIAGLVCAADLARRDGDRASGRAWLRLADRWAAKVDDWTFTRTGPYGGGRYYLRIVEDGDPDDGDPVELSDGGGTHDERAIVDPSFLELVRLGVKRADDPGIRRTVGVVDRHLRVDTPNGPYWHRYNFDGYGEHADGSPWDLEGIGRIWPLLTGERGEYRLAYGRPATLHLRSMARAAGAGRMIAEQVWDRPRPTRSNFRFGEGTASATPLGWSHGQFLRLAASIDAGRPVETPSIVACRYSGLRCR